jgi:hypothetical protein
MMATLMCSPCTPWSCHAMGAPMNGTLRALLGRKSRTGVTDVTPGSVASCATLLCGMLTRMPLMAEA